MQTVCNTYWDAGKGNLTAHNTRKPFGGRGSAPDPAEGAYSAPANPLVGGEGLAVPSPRTVPSPRIPSPTLRPSDLASSTPTPKLVPTPMSVTHRFHVGLQSLCQSVKVHNMLVLRTQTHTHTHTHLNPPHHSFIHSFIHWTSSCQHLSPAPAATLQNAIKTTHTNSELIKANTIKYQ